MILKFLLKSLNFLIADSTVERGNLTLRNKFLYVFPFLNIVSSSSKLSLIEKLMYGLPKNNN